MNSNKNIKVSVCVLAYNHEKYIRECLDSILDQVCNFQFEVIVGEDCSTDGTRNVVREYVKKYPTILKPVFHDRNVGGVENYFSVFDKVSGIYCAYIDGDDYMLPGKLKKQADFLDANPDVNIVWSCMIGINAITGEEMKTKRVSAPTFYNRGDLLALGTIGAASSKMVRAECISLWDREYKEYFDFSFNVFEIGDKQACLLPDILGVYNAYVTVNNDNNYYRRLHYIANLVQLKELFPAHKAEIGAQLVYLTLYFLRLRNIRIFYSHLKVIPKLFTLKSLMLFVKYHVLRRY